VKALESYDHITLTEEETAGALLEAKRRKQLILDEERRREMEESNRRFLFGNWDVTLTRNYMLARAEKIFKGAFRVDAENQAFVELMCLYFAKDPIFVDAAAQCGIKDPSLEKGLLLGGAVGVGKTWLMQLFSRNRRQVYFIRSAKLIADAFGKDGEEGMGPFTFLNKLPVNDMDNFYHPNAGLCIDDIGTEELKIHYGNRKNVIGDLIEKRYELGNTGTLLHMTTNLTMDQVKEFYGVRVGSRLRETMNIILQKGRDRRK